MKKTFCYIFVLLCGLCFAFAAQGQNADDWNDEETVETDVPKEMDFSRPKMFSAPKYFGKSKKEYARTQYLMIEYPWTKIQNATLEVRIIGPEAEKQPQFCKPVYLMNVYGTLEKIDKDILNKKLGTPSTRDNIEYSIALFHEYSLPEPESLELATIKPVAGARADYFHMVYKNPDTNELETTLIFHDISQWAVDSERLALVLCGKAIKDAEGKNIKEIEFEKPCKIKLWLLRDDYVVWEETFQWPGTKKETSQKPSAKKAAPKFDDDDEDPRQAAKKMENIDKSQKNEDQPEDAGDDADFEGFGDDF